MPLTQNTLLLKALADVAESTGQHVYQSALRRKRAGVRSAEAAAACPMGRFRSWMVWFCLAFLPDAPVRTLEKGRT